MALIACICYLIAFVCFLAATANVPARFSLVGAGLAAWIFPALIVALKALG